MDTETSVKLRDITKVTPSSVGDVTSDGENEDLFKSFTRSHDELVTDVTHEVLVYENCC